MRKLTGISVRYILRCILPAFLTLTTVFIAKAHHGSRTILEASPLEGRWDITVDVDGKKSPSWLEVRHSGLHALVGYFVGVSGSARPVSRVNFADGKLSFSIPAQWEEQDKDLSVEGTLDGDNLSGTMVFSDGKPITGRASGLRLSGANRNLCGESRFIYLMERTLMNGTLWVKINGKRKMVL